MGEVSVYASAIGSPLLAKLRRFKRSLWPKFAPPFNQFVKVARTVKMGYDSALFLRIADVMNEDSRAVQW